MISTSNQSSPLPLPSSLVPTITPASLSSLAIYNPSLGATDNTLPDQLVFYTSRRGSAVTENEKLRQIGLAQGIAEFARGFSNTTDSCTSVETEKSRVVTLELEPNWWIHAQIELTYIHNPTVQPPTAEYSNREVSPPQLLLAQLKKAYSQFRFHYGTLAMNWDRLDRAAFCKCLEKYWLRWAWIRWEVTLHGSPVVDLLAEEGVKMAGGRLGKEIGDHERGFLEGWAKKENTRGLVDMVVSRFGEEKLSEVSNNISQQTTKAVPGGWFWSSPYGDSSKKNSKKKAKELSPVLTPTDGCVFKGINTVEVMDVSNYLRELYETGDDTYMVISNGIRRKRRRRRPESLRLEVSSGEGSPRRSTSTVRHIREGSNGSVFRTESSPELELLEPIHPETETKNSSEDPKVGETSTNAKQQSPSIANGKILNLLTFGWSGRVQQLGRSTTPSSDTGDNIVAEEDLEAPQVGTEIPPNSNEGKKRGAFLVGYQGDLDLEDIDDDHEDSSARITSRTVWLRRTTSSEQTDSMPSPLEEFKLVVYTNNPFIFAFIFAPTSRSLTSPRFYRSLHHQLSPLVRSLLQPPIPIIAPFVAYKPPFDLLLLSAPSSVIYTTLPPIPGPGIDAPGWTRADALHVYTIILGMLQEGGDREKSVRSMRGWWINWMKLDRGRGEGFVVRRAGEAKQGAGSGADGTAQVDVKKYFEALVKGR